MCTEELPRKTNNKSTRPTTSQPRRNNLCTIGCWESSNRERQKAQSLMSGFQYHCKTRDNCIQACLSQI